MLQWLIESGIDLSVRNSQGKTALDIAKRFGNKTCVKILGGNPGRKKCKIFCVDLNPLTNIK